MNNLLQNITKIDWYRQETEGTPYFIYVPCCGCLTFFKTPGRALYYCASDNCRAYFDKEFLREKAIAYLQKEKIHPGTFETMFTAWMKVVAGPNEILYKKIVAKNIHELDDASILRLHSMLVQRVFKMWNNFFMDFYDLDAEGLVEKELVAAGITLTDVERAVLMKQELPITHQRLERDVLSVAKLVKDTPGALNTFLYISAPANLHRLKLYPKIEQAIANLQADYFWIYNSWANTQVLNAYDFVLMVKEILAGSRDIDRELLELKNFKTSILQDKKAIAKQHKFSPWLNSLFHFFGILSYWRDERKAQVQQMNHYLEMLGTEIAVRSGLTWGDIRVCDPRAITSIPVSKSIIKKYQKQCREDFMFSWQGKKITHFKRPLSGQLFKTVENIIQRPTTEIRGMIACPGKVHGQVIVINKESEFGKMRSGAILVTPMTRPEFVPLMKLAAAIVTDEGGITSHAAVVSRELKVPCIIGTQVASKMLKDGDEVFVNADHGIVMVL